ncbi:MAG: NAD(P)/FAD-dependent oxidoreductase [Deltaproteobacteria bacterium]|nr:NAD(P)/FAD-dependent oxidoreductase [Deltaproteobacteria bacterium]
MDAYDIIVIGGGAAGLMAAGFAARSGVRVLVLEKMDYPARKLGITGKGRCNLTNTAGHAEFLKRFGNGAGFLRPSLESFDNRSLMDFFSGIGIELVAERGGRVFPADARAPRVSRALRAWCEAGGARIVCDSPVTEICTENGRVTRVRCGQRSLSARAVIVATGGASYPLTGSTGDGYLWSAALGHTIVPVRPALIGLETRESRLCACDGLSVRNCRARLVVNGRERAEEFGELQLMRYGLSGPVILTLSGMAVDALLARKKVQVSIDLKPSLSREKLEARLKRDISSRGAERLGSLLRGLLPRELVGVCCTQAGLKPGSPSAGLKERERARLLDWLKNFTHTVSGHRPLDEAIITAGGVSLAEVDPHTMESQLVRGLYFAGEILDLQADTGGYNLQAAFSTGRAAGRAAAKA